MPRSLSTHEFRAQIEALCRRSHDELRRTVELHQALSDAAREVEALRPAISARWE